MEDLQGASIGWIWYERVPATETLDFTNENFQYRGLDLDTVLLSCLQTVVITAPAATVHGH